MTTPRPCSPQEAVQRARDLVASPTNQEAEYWLSGGDYHATWTTPWTRRNGVWVGDCRVAVLWPYKLPADRPGYNNDHGEGWATVSDCINYNSLREDAEHAQDLVTLVADAPQEGDIVCYSTLHIVTHEDGVQAEHTFIGHGAIVVGVERWDGQHFGTLDIMQVCGGPGRKPAAILSTAAHFDVARPPATWPKPEHQVRLLRVVP